MWFLSLLPSGALEFFVNAALVLGIFGLLASYFISNKLLPVQKAGLQLVSIVLLVLGVYWKGGIEIEKEWRAKVEAADKRAKDAEVKAAAATARVEYVFQDKVKTVKEVQILVHEKIRDVSLTIDSQCKITKETVDILNDAARNKVEVKK